MASLGFLGGLPLADQAVDGVQRALQFLALVVGVGVGGKLCLTGGELGFAVSQLLGARGELRFAVGQLHLTVFKLNDTIHVGVIVVSQLLDAGQELVVDGGETGFLVLRLVVLDIQHVLHAGDSGEETEEARGDQAEAEDCKQYFFHIHPPLYCYLYFGLSSRIVLLKYSLIFMN